MTVTGEGTESGLPVTDDDDAVVTLVIQPLIQVVKTADPLVRAVPGGNFTFTVVVSNPGVEPVEILTLRDDIYGNIENVSGTGPGGRTFTNSTCGALIGDVLAPGASSAPCTFVGSFTNATPASQTDVVTVTGEGTQSGLPVTDNDDAVGASRAAADPGGQGCEPRIPASSRRALHVHRSGLQPGVRDRSRS